MGQLAVVTTDSVKQDELKGIWKRWLSSYVACAPDERDTTGVRFEPDNVQQFKGCIEHGSLGDAGICRVVSSSYRYVRTAQESAGTASSTMVVLQTRGKSCFQQDGRKSSLFPGDWNVFDPSRAFSVISTGQSENLVLLLPGGAAGELRAMLEAMPGRSFGRSGIECTVRDLISVSFRECQKMSHRSGATVTGSIAQMIHSSVEEAASSNKPAAPSLKDQILEFIELNLGEEELGVGSIAQAFACSTRQIHRLFQDEARMTVSKYIWKSRLEHSFRDLRDTVLHQHSITDIAFNRGFSNAAHFSRLFKETYGMTPREYRRARSS